VGRAKVPLLAPWVFLSYTVSDVSSVGMEFFLVVNNLRPALFFVSYKHVCRDVS